MPKGIKIFRRGERERRILGLMAQGLSNREIAARLGFTYATTRVYVTEILQALGARTRTRAVFLAVSRGLVRYQSKAS